MALSRWRLLGGSVIAAVILALLLLPGGPLSQAGVLSWLFLPYGWYSSPRPFRDDVQMALRVQRARLRDAERADSVVGATHGPRALHTPDGGLTVVYETPLTASDAHVWLQAAATELDRYPTPGSGGMPVVIALYSNPTRSKSREFGFYAWPSHRLLPDSGRAACVVEVDLVPFRPPGGKLHQPRRLPERPFLGLCGLYQRFGAPGYSIARWIGYAGVMGFRGGDGSWNDALAEARRPVLRSETVRPNLAGFREWPWYWGTPWVSIGCLRGTLSLCERNARISGRPGEWEQYANPHGAQLTAYLLATGTPVQFAAFWRSPLPVNEALRRAYGRPAGQLAYEAFSHWHYAAPGGPRAEPRLLLAGLFWASAAAALALVAGRRWRTEI